MNIDKPQRGVAVKIGRKMRGYQGCQQVHFLYPDLEPSYALKELNDRWEDGYEIFLPSQEEREERCARCGIGVIVPPVESAVFPTVIETLETTYRDNPIRSAALNQRFLSFANI